MAGQRKYSEELRERATRMALEAIAVEGKRMVVIRRIAGQLDIHPEALRSWSSGVEVPTVPWQRDGMLALSLLAGERPLAI